MMQEATSRQRGVTFVGLLLVLALIGFAALVAMRLVPIYIEAYSVGDILANMSSQARVEGSDHKELRDTFQRRLSINDIESVDRSDLKFTDVAGGTQVGVEYEARRPLLGNLDIVAKFHKTALLRN